MAGNRGPHPSRQADTNHRPPSLLPRSLGLGSQRRKARTLSWSGAGGRNLVSQQTPRLAQVPQDGVAIERTQGGAGGVPRRGHRVDPDPVLRQQGQCTHYLMDILGSELRIALSLERLERCVHNLVRWNVRFKERLVDILCL